MNTFTVETDREVKPDLVKPEIYGHHASYINEISGKRKWLFDEKMGYDKFLQDVANGMFRSRK